VKVGERSNIEIIQENNGPALYIYLHWASPGEARSSLAAALRHPDAVARMDDPSYLTRTIVREMTAVWGQGETGMGLTVGHPDDGEIVARLHMPTQTVDGLPIKRFIDEAIFSEGRTR